MSKSKGIRKPLPALPTSFTSIQKEVLIGSMLGDGHLGIDNPTAKTSRFKIDRAIADQNYLRWEFSIFRYFCSSDESCKIRTEHDPRYDTYKEYIKFRTRNSSLFRSFHQDWYVRNNIGENTYTKIVPTNWELSPLILAIWFADDGHIQVSGDTAFLIKLSTESFTKIEVEYLKDKINSFLGEGVKFRTKLKDKKNPNQWVIKCTDAFSCQQFLKVVRPYLDVMGMSRKHDDWRCHDLDIDPINGLPENDNRPMYRKMLELQDFSIADLMPHLGSGENNTSQEQVRNIINKLDKELKILERYVGTEWGKPYRWKFNDKAVNYLERKIRQLTGIYEKKEYKSPINSITAQGVVMINDITEDTI